MTQLAVPDEEDGLARYKTHYLRRQMVAHVLKNKELFKDWLRDWVRQIYGTGEGGLGPYSARTYLEYIVKDKSWGDGITCVLIASM